MGTVQKSQTTSKEHSVGETRDVGFDLWLLCVAPLTLLHNASSWANAKSMGGETAVCLSAGYGAFNA
jgi:hypothetical protein